MLEKEQHALFWTTDPLCQRKAYLEDQDHEHSRCQYMPVFYVETVLFDVSRGISKLSIPGNREWR